MRDPRIRALCAQIALELDQKKVDALVAELKRILTLSSEFSPIPIDKPDSEQTSTDQQSDQNESRKTGTE